MNSLLDAGHRLTRQFLLSVELKIPKLCQGSYFPEFLEPRRTAEKALTV